jgi:hypothetical protein
MKYLHKLVPAFLTCHRMCISFVTIYFFVYLDVVVGVTRGQVPRIRLIVISLKEYERDTHDNIMFLQHLTR